MKTVLKFTRTGHAPMVEPEQAAPAWSGKPMAELTDDDVRDICAQAEVDGWEAAAQDACNGTAPTKNPFDQDFLGGVPSLLWNMAYRRCWREGQLTQCGAAMNAIVRRATAMIPVGA